MSNLVNLCSFKSNVVLEYMNMYVSICGIFEFMCLLGGLYVISHFFAVFRVESNILSASHLVSLLFFNVPMAIVRILAKLLENLNIDQ